MSKNIPDTDLLTFKNSRSSNLTRLNILKERVLFGVVCFLLIILLLIGYTFLDPENSVDDKDRVERTEQELITGAKRFVSCLYSLDAATIRQDQFCAVDMMQNIEDKKLHEDYLKHNELIALSESKGVKTYFLWDNAKVDFSENDHETSDVTINVPYTIVGLPDQLINIIITVIPIEKTDKNSMGVGVVRWRDLAINPFPEKVHVEDI